MASRDLEPRCRGGKGQNVDLLFRDEQRVAGCMSRAGLLGVAEQERRVVDHRDVRVDHRVPAAGAGHAARRRCRTRRPACTPVQRPPSCAAVCGSAYSAAPGFASTRAGSRCRVDVVGVLMGDQDGVQSGDALESVREVAGIEEDFRTVQLDEDTGMAKMSQSHDFEYAPPCSDSQAGFAASAVTPRSLDANHLGAPGKLAGSPERSTPGSRTSTEEQHVARVVVEVMPKAEILDPQGQAIVGALSRLGFAGVSDVRQGKRFELEVDGSVDDAELEKIAEAPAGQHGDRGLDREARRGMSARIGVITFPGTLDDVDAARAVTLAGGEAVEPLARRRRPQGCRRGRRSRWLLLRRLPALRRDRTVRARDGQGRRGRAGRHAGPRHLQRLPGPVRSGSAARRADPQRGPALHLPRRVAEGRGQRRRRGRPATRRAPRSWSRSSRARAATRRPRTSSTNSRARAASCSATSATTRTVRSVGIAGISSANGRVVGLMPHPEHATEALTGPSDDGLGMFYSVLDSVISA